MSCPSSSSSSSTHASLHITHFVHSLLSSAGFSKSSSQAIQLLTEVFERYLLLLGSTSKQHTSHSGRQITLPCDVEVCLNELGTSTNEIERWFDEEGGDIAGRWLELGTDGIPARLDLPSAKQLGARQTSGKIAASDKGSMTLHYETVDAETRARLEALLLPESEEEDDDDDDDGSANVGMLSSPPPPYQPSPASGTSPSQPPTYKKRRRSNSSFDYVPPFLPGFPQQDRIEITGQTHVGEADAEFLRARTETLERGEERRELLDDSGHAPTSKGDGGEAQAWAALDMAPTSKRTVEDSWHSAVDFASSILAQQQSIEDIPEATNIDIREEAEVDSVSSHRIFANDYLNLVSEAASVPPTLLTPVGSGSANAFNQRRLLASLLADPSKYVPCDTIYGAIDARPSALPFQPGPSLLITNGTTSNPAPTFTPIRFSGREIISTSTMNHSLHPICRHRIPSNVLNASRFMSGGESSEIYRRVTRSHDPIPILDERHAERVFHGIPAPKEHLSESNSYLREALDVLKVKRAEEMKASIEGGSFEEQQSQLSLSASRDQTRVKSGTLVQTWDWLARDYADPVLPAKKFRSGTSGVLLGAGGGAAGGGGANTSVVDADQDHVRSRSMSIQFS